MDLHDFADVVENYDYYLPSVAASNNDDLIKFHLSWSLSKQSRIHYTN
jgi:hypothetical protein